MGWYKKHTPQIGTYILLCLSLSLLLCSCGKKEEEPVSSDTPASHVSSYNPSEHYSKSALTSYDSSILEQDGIDTENTPLYEMIAEDLSLDERMHGEVEFVAEDAFSYASKVHCLFDMPTQQMVFQACFDKIPASDDENLYLFIIDTFENEDLLNKEPDFSTQKGHTMQICMEYNRTYLFARFMPALLIDGSYVPLCYGQYMSNPELLAPNGSDYPEIGSKKGLLIDPATLGTDKLTELGVKHAVYNIPLSQIIGESTNPDIETIEFEYNDHIYYFNGATVAAYDSLFMYLTEQGMYTTAIILNDWNPAHPEMIHPLSRNRTSSALYYAFNTEEEEGVRLMEATALFLAERYTSGWYGMVYNWVIANEINQQTVWNFMNTTDLDYYTDSFERAFRIFYNAIRSRYANAKVYFSIDHDWNDNKGKNSKWFNGRDLVYAFNHLGLQHGNYDWGIAIHPYPDPLTRINYWSMSYDMTEEAGVLSIMNLSSLTDVLKKQEFLDTDGNVRSVAITELGFSSYSGEKLQAAAFAYCYYIIDNNPYIESFMMNRQTDAREEMRAGLAFGVYNPDLTDKYIYEVFRDIDTDRAKDHMEFMLNILGADSLEEALTWANP